MRGKITMNLVLNLKNKIIFPHFFNCKMNLIKYVDNKQNAIKNEEIFFLTDFDIYTINS